MSNANAGTAAATVLAMCVVECSFPTFTKVQALWTLYFSERYGLPMEQVRDETALLPPSSGYRSAAR